MDDATSSFDSTGMFYYTPPRRIEEAVLVRMSTTGIAYARFFRSSTLAHRIAS